MLQRTAPTSLAFVAGLTLLPAQEPATAPLPTATLLAGQTSTIEVRLPESAGY